MPRGVRLNPKHDERTRAKIQTSQIINRLTNFVEGQCELSAAQVTAALGLLRKTLPDLQSTELEAHVTKTTVSAEPMQPDEWAHEYAATAESSDATH